MPNFSGIGNALMQISAATNGAQGSADYNNALAKIPAMNAATDLTQAQAFQQQQENQTRQSALAKLAELSKNGGANNPQQILSALASISPEYAIKAAEAQAANPLGSIMQSLNGGQPQGGAPAQPGAAPAPQQEIPSGDALLQRLPPAIADQVKAISEGRQSPPNGMSMRTPYGQQLMALVNQYDPTFDTVNVGARAATRKDFTSGSSAKNITALNTAMGHLQSLSDAYDDLGNTDYPTVNKVKNYLGNEFGNKKIQTDTTSVGTSAQAVSEELAKVFRSTGMSESDIKAWKDKINTDTTPAQSKALVTGAIELLNSRLDALGQQYNQGMGTTKNGIELLSPKAQKAYAKLTGEPAAETAVSGNLAADQATQAAPAQGGTPDGTIIKNKAGVRMKRVGGQWVKI